DARHWVKAERNPSAGQVVPEPVQVSTSSQGPAAARHTAPALPPGCWQLSLLPSHSSRLQGFPSLVQAVPAGCFASAGQTVLDPVQVSARSHSPAVGRHVAPAFPAGCWHASLEPSQASVLHGLPSSVQLVPAALFASTGQLAADPVQFSAGSHSPADGRQTAPPLPAGCWQASLEPSHVSVVHGLPSSVHAVPDGVFASAGHVGPLPGQFSAGSHSPADARQTVLAGSKASFGHVVLVPVQVSSTSHAPADPRQTEPALPAGCWQASFVTSESSVLHGFPSSVHAVPAGSFASAG